MRDAYPRDGESWLIVCSVGPAHEAFGCERILFGSSPSPSSRASTNAGDWYELVREAFAEMGFEQQDLDDLFAENARRVYGSSS